MSQRWIEDSVREYVSSLHRQLTKYEVRDCEESKRLLCCLNSRCLAAFFSIVPQNSGVKAFVHEVEDEIRIWRDENKWEYLDLNLVLLFQKVEIPQVLSDLRHDSTLCRKFVLFPKDPSNLRNQLAYLPFFPMETDEALSLHVLSLDPEMLLRRSGVSVRFSRDLVAHRPGAQTLARMVTKKEYVLADKADSSIDATSKKVYERQRSDLVNRYSVSLEKITLKNFRGIGRKVELALGGGITVLFGINGTGKTSVCDAIEWAVTGNLARVKKPDSDAKQHETERSVINYFADNQEASVELLLGDKAGLVKRRVNETLKQIVAASEGDNDWGAIQSVAQLLLRRGLDIRRAREAFRSSHILEQSTIRDFLNRDPIERFEALNRILGYEELVRLTHKMLSVRGFVETEVQKREPKRSEAEQKLRERETVAKAIEKSIKNRESALSSQPARDRIFKEVVVEAKACEVPAPEPPDLLSPGAMKQWLGDVTEALTAVDNSLKDTLKKSRRCLQLAEKVNAEKKEIGELKAKISAGTSDEKKLIEKVAKLETNLASTTVKRKDLKANLDSLRREVRMFQWLSSNSIILRQEESKLKSEQQELVRIDEQVLERQAEFRRLQDRLNVIVTQVNTKTQEVKRTETRRSAIEELIKLRQEWSRTAASIGKLDQERDDLAKCISRLNKGIESLRGRQIEARRKHVRLRKHAKAEEAAKSRRSQLLVEIRETLSPSEKACPFCGFEYKDHEDLLHHMERVEETPSEGYRMALSKAKEAEKKLSSVEDELKAKEDLLENLMDRIKKNTQRLTEDKIRLRDFRDKAVALGILPKGANDAFVPEEGQLHDALAEVNVSNVEQALEDLKLEEQDVRYKIVLIQEALQESTKKRQSIISSIEENQERINSLQGQASTEGALDLLALSENEIRERMGILRKKIEDTTRSISELNATHRRTTQEQGSIRQQAADLNRLLERWQKSVSVASKREARLKESLLNIGFEGDMSPSVLTKFQAGLEAQIRRLHQLRKRCSILSDILQLDALRGELSQAKQNVEHEKIALTKIITEIQELKKKLSGIDHVSNTFQKLTVIDMTNTLKALSTPLNNIFERLNGHPLFGSLKIEPDEKSKTVTFRVETPQNVRGSSGVVITRDVPPRSYLSDAQLNIVALSIFLAIALYQKWSRFKLIVVDDPVQQMDDLNAASFIDLIREISVQNRRQFIITTCNAEFYRLALSKLGCLNKKDVTMFRAYRLEGLRREGPEIIVDAPYWENDEAQAAKPY